MLSFKLRSLVVLFLVLTMQPLWPQENDPASYIGLTLSSLIGQLGAPQAVHAVRGINDWQDDVVFVYDYGDFYIFRDRVWQLGLKSSYRRIRVGDPRNTVFLTFGDAVSSGNDYAIFTLDGYPWPMAMRFNFDTNGRVTMIFIYRSDL